MNELFDSIEIDRKYIRWDGSIVFQFNDDL